VTVGRVAPASSASKERLERISHHFLSAPGDGPPKGPRAPLMVPVVAVPGSPEFPLETLSQALLARGRPAVVLDARRDVGILTRPSPSTQAHPETPVPPDPQAGGGGPARPPAAPVVQPGDALEAARALDPAPALCLVPLSADAWPLPKAFTHPLLIVPAHRDGVREAFLCAKQAHAWGLKGPVGVVMTDAADSAAAARHFEHLADAVWRFLGLDTVSYGALPASAPPHAAVDLLGPAPEARVDAALAGIARLLAADLPEPEPAPAAGARSKGHPGA
jgi:hypothetical protein